MKKALVAIALAGFASTATALINNGSHDLQGNPRFTGGTLSACQYCHAPHNVNTAVTGTPLWNRTASAAFEATFTPYTSATLTTAANLGANSLTCLSCHDGTSLLGTMFVGSSQTLTPNTLAASYANVGKTLQNDHPVGIPYVGGATGTAAWQSVGTVTTAGLKLYSDGAGNVTVECGSCHDPHGNSDGVTGGLSFLRTAAATDICLACHIK